MGKRPKTRSELEHLRGVIRSLEAENRQLRKQLARSDKELQKAVDMASTVLDDITYHDMQYSSEPKCPKCANKLKHVDLGTRTLVLCSNTECTYRKTNKHGQTKTN
jgi:hypothetical protein